MKESDLREILREAGVDVVHKNSRGWLVIFWLVIGALSGYTPAMRFKPIPQDNQFEISEDGTIVRRIVPAWGTRVGKCLSLREKDGAYLRVKLMGKCYQVHVLVCTAFHGPPPEGKPFALHINDLPKDNHFTNLRWGSREDNFADAKRNRRLPTGEAHPRAKLRWAQVLVIRKMKGTKSEYALAREFGVSRPTINQILTGKIWHEKSGLI
jgi:hypothetical protein